MKNFATLQLASAYAKSLIEAHTPPLLLTANADTTYTIYEQGDAALLPQPSAADISAAAAAAALAAQDTADALAVKANNAVKTFVNMTPAQVDAYIAANVTNIATAVNMLQLLAKAVLILARNQYRQ
jgi:hypothetical protein